MSTPLSVRDANAPLTTLSQSLDAKPAEAKPQSLEYHRQVLHSRMQNEGSQKTYISPSDMMMSPCTAKLSAMKNRNFMKKGKPQTLFAQASAKNAGTTSAPAFVGTTASQSQSEGRTQGQSEMQL